MLSRVLARRCETVPAYRECNSLLGASCQDSLGERKHLLKRRLARRYGKYLRIPTWDLEQIDGLGERFRQHVEQGLALKELTLDRLRW